MGAAARDAGVEARANQPAKPPKKRFDATTWGGALLVMAIIAAALFVLEGIDALTDHHLDRFGLRPRHVSGLWGIVTMPLMHANWWQLISIVGPFVLIGWVVLLSGVRTFVIVTAVVLILGGAASWLIGPDKLVVGSSPIVFGWVGYLVARAIFSRKILWILGAIAVVFFFSGLFGGLLPSINATVPWEVHVCGFVAGALIGWVLHPSKKRRQRRQAKPAPSVS